MANGKFAPITASLFARKGEAGPSIMGRPSLVWPEETPVSHSPAEPDRKMHVPKGMSQSGGNLVSGGGGKPRRVVLTLTPGEYERLAIAAVKQQTTPQRIVRDALDLHLIDIAANFRDCACLGASPCECGACTAD